MLVVVGRFNYILFIHVSLSIYPHTKKKTPTFLVVCVCVYNTQCGTDDTAIQYGAMYVQYTSHTSSQKSWVIIERER